MTIVEHKGDRFVWTDGSTVYPTMLKKQFHSKDEVIQGMIDRRAAMGASPAVEIHYVDNGDSFGVVLIPSFGVGKDPSVHR